MKKLSIFKLLTVLLLGLNLALIGFIFMNRPPHPFPEKGEKMAEKMLHLTKDQSQQFKNLAEEHHLEMKEVDEAQSVYLIQYFSQLENGRNTESELLLSQYSEMEKNRLELTLTHFEELKSILDESQYEYLYSFVNRIVKEVIVGGAKPPRPHRQ